MRATTTDTMTPFSSALSRLRQSLALRMLHRDWPSIREYRRKLCGRSWWRLGTASRRWKGFSRSMLTTWNCGHNRTCNCQCGVSSRRRVSQASERTHSEVRRPSDIRRGTYRISNCQRWSTRIFQCETRPSMLCKGSRCGVPIGGCHRKKKDVMEMIGPGKIGYGGTYNANPVALGLYGHP